MRAVPSRHSAVQGSGLLVLSATVVSASWAKAQPFAVAVKVYWPSVSL
jgi:hypothetical protein